MHAQLGNRIKAEMRMMTVTSASLPPYTSNGLRTTLYSGAACSDGTSCTGLNATSRFGTLFNTDLIADIAFEMCGRIT